MSDLSEEAIYLYLWAHGVTEDSARTAAQKCANAADRGAALGGFVGYAGGAAAGIGLAEASVVTGGGALAVAALVAGVGAAHGAYHSAIKCEEVQRLVDQVNSDPGL
jgi:hypothetical protein